MCIYSSMHVYIYIYIHGSLIVDREMNTYIIYIQINIYIYIYIYVYHQTSQCTYRVYVANIYKYTYSSFFIRKYMKTKYFI